MARPVMQIQKGYRYVFIWTFKKMKTSKKLTTNIKVKASKEDLAGTKSTN